MAYKLLTMLAPVNPKGARSGIKMNTVIGVTIHMTDNWGKGAGAISHGNYLQHSGSTVQASWHYCVDDTYAVQSIPENEVSWSAGDGYGNGNMRTISIEIALNPESDLTKACDNAAELAADILKRHKLSADKIYRHYDWSGKWCPSQMMNGKPYNWTTFKNKVKAAYNEDKVTVTPSTDVDIKDTASIGVGSTVYFDGKSPCYSSSNGSGQGSTPPAGNYKVTHYAPGTLCSVHIGSYGWVPAKNCGLTPGVDNEKVESNPTASSSKDIKVGSTVYFDGKSPCYATSAKTGKGSTPPAGNYKVTHYDEDAKCPIHIGSYGWVPAANCGIKVTTTDKPATTTSTIKLGSTVYFDGKSPCYSSSNGSGQGSTPPAGNYKVEYYNKGAKCAVHIGSYGWVPEKNCSVAKTAAKPKTPAVGKTVYFDGKSPCYSSSNGTGQGATPPKGNYKITYYSKNAKCPIHIGSYGWVPAANCTVK